jgi:hypothetical protein
LIDIFIKISDKSFKLAGSARYETINGRDVTFVKIIDMKKEDFLPRQGVEYVLKDHNKAEFDAYELLSKNPLTKPYIPHYFTCWSKLRLTPTQTEGILVEKIGERLEQRHIDNDPGLPFEIFKALMEFHKAGVHHMDIKVCDFL